MLTTVLYVCTYVCLGEQYGNRKEIFRILGTVLSNQITPTAANTNTANTITANASLEQEEGDGCTVVHRDVVQRVRSMVHQYKSSYSSVTEYQTVISTLPMNIQSHLYM